MMKSFDGGSTGCPEKRLTARSKLPHQAFTGDERPRIWRPHRREHEGGLCSGRQVVGHLRGVVGGVLVVLVQGRRPRRLLGSRVDVHRPGDVAHCRQQLTCHLGNRPVRRERDPPCAPVAVLGHRLVIVQVECRNERTRSVACREREGLPSSCGETQRRVLQLRLGRGQRDGELAEHLRVRVQRVARGPPCLVGERNPLLGRRHRGESCTTVGCQ